MVPATETAHIPSAGPIQLPLRPFQPVETPTLDTDTPKRCRLLELPLELRISIYEYLLPNKQALCIFSRDSRNVPEPAVGYYGLTIGKGILCLAFCCRSLYEECMKMVYGWFDFTTFSAKTLIHWLEDIGSMKQYLKHVSVSLDWTRFVPKALPRLQQVTSLRTLELNFRVRQSVDSIKLARDLKPMLEGISKCMREQREDEKWERVLEVVRFPLMVGKEDGENQDLVAVEAYAREFREEVRRLLQA